MLPSLGELLQSGSVKAAQELIGWCLYVLDNGQKVGGTIIETEAYNQEDAASHTFNGQTARNSVMFGQAGHAYVFFTYGMHWCFNIVTGGVGSGEAVLIRAILPESGIGIIRQRRNNQPDAELTNGPAKLCQALAITGEDNGARINNSRFILEPPIEAFKTIATPRIGIRKDIDRLWRFVVTKD